ncbi:MAG: AI-2E family transporter, partial [Phycisphaerales bacterium]|nr:AI-2E family transporter [Phycisphaerales bacterium]
MEKYLPKLTERGKRWARFLSLIATTVALIWTILYLRSVLTPIAAALAIAYILNPVVTWMEREQGVRRVTSISVGIGALLIIGASVVFAGVVQTLDLSARLPQYIVQGQEWLTSSLPGLINPPEYFTSRKAEPEPGESQSQTTEQSSEPEHQSAEPENANAVPIADQPPTDGAAPWQTGHDLRRLVADHGLTVASSIAAYVSGMITNLFHILTLVVLIPMYAFFFLLNFNEMVRVVHDHIPIDYRPTIVRVVTTADRAIADFFRGRLIVCTIIGAVTGIGWQLVGVKYGLLIGALAGLLNLIPFMTMLALPMAIFGAYLGATEIQAPWFFPVVLAFLVFIAAQALETFVLTPTIESKA